MRSCSAKSKGADALQNKTQLTRWEWDSFKVVDLRKNHYVQFGKAYFPSVFASFRQLTADRCIYVYEGTGGEKIILAHYVDDNIFATNAPRSIIPLFNYDMKDTDEGTLDRFTGVHFERSADTRS